MDLITGLEQEGQSILNETTDFLQNPIAAGVVGTAVGLGAGGILGSIVKNVKTRRSRTKRGRSRDRRFISKQRWEISYTKKHGKGKRKYYKSKKSREKIHYARKTGQPYIILANGRAKFIKGKRRLK